MTCDTSDTWNAKCDIKLTCDTMCDTMCDTQPHCKRNVMVAGMSLRASNQWTMTSVSGLWLSTAGLVGRQPIIGLVGSIGISSIGRLGSKEVGGH